MWRWQFFIALLGLQSVVTAQDEEKERLRVQLASAHSASEADDDCGPSSRPVSLVSMESSEEVMDRVHQPVLEEAGTLVFISC
jgi:hypothetical protein